MKNQIPTIHADYNNRDVKGRLRLVTVGTLEDLARLGVTLKEGLKARFTDGEVIGEAIVTYSNEEECWVGELLWWKLVEEMTE